MRLDRGTVIFLDLDPTVGHEQRDVRPCVVVSDPEVVADQRFPLCVVPAKGTPGDGALCPPLGLGHSGLTKMAHALIDYLRSVDKRRVRRVFGQLAPGEIGAIDDGLALFLGFGDRLEPESTPRFSST